MCEQGPPREEWMRTPSKLRICVLRVPRSPCATVRQKLVTSASTDKARVSMMAIFRFLYKQKAGYQHDAVPKCSCKGRDESGKLCFAPCKSATPYTVNLPSDAVTSATKKDQHNPTYLLFMTCRTYRTNAHCGRSAGESNDLLCGISSVQKR
jgi:hypothetical protein